jgi:hypothetical protein
MFLSFNFVQLECPSLLKHCSMVALKASYTLQKGKKLTGK